MQINQLRVTLHCDGREGLEAASHCRQATKELARVQHSVELLLDAMLSSAPGVPARAEPPPAEQAVAAPGAPGDV